MTKQRDRTDTACGGGLYNLVARETEDVVRQTADDSFPLHTPFSVEDLADRLVRYEAITSRLAALVACECHRGNPRFEDPLVRCLERLASPPSPGSGRYTWTGLRLYPALLVLYAGGIAALCAGNSSTLVALLAKTRVRRGQTDAALILAVNACDVLERRAARQLPDMARSEAPMSERLYGVLRRHFKEMLPDDCGYRRCFDRFEYLLGLVFADLCERSQKRTWVPIGCYAWRGGEGRSVVAELRLEVEEQGADWPFIRLGLFGGSVERFWRVKRRVDGFIEVLD